MLRQVILLLIFSSLALSSIGQFGNEWINYGQQYWRLNISDTEVHNISYEDLQQSGMPIQGASIDSFRLFAKGEQQHVQIVDDGNGVFNSGDYIIVNLEKNDGWLDAQLYQSPEDQNNSHYSLFNDTARVYMTVGGLEDPLRTEVYETDSNMDLLSELNFVLSETRQEFTSDYFFGIQDQNGIALPWYQEAEGWFDSRFGKGQARAYTLSTPQVYNGADAPDAKVRTISASTSLATGLVNHHLQVGYGDLPNVVIDSVYYGYQLNRLDFYIPLLEMSSSTRVVHRSVDDLAVETDYHAISSIEVAYPRIPSFAGETKAEFAALSANAQLEMVLNIPEFGGNNPHLFVLGLGFRMELTLEPYNGGWRAIVPFDQGPRQELLLIDESEYVTSANIEPATDTGYFQDYLSAQQDSAMVIISHKKLMPAAQNYATYKHLNGLNTVVVDVEELYQQYAGGVYKHPLAIRNFCDALLSNWTSEPSYLFIIGKSIHEMNISSALGSRKSETFHERSLVPSFGHPTSDIALTAGLNGTEWQAAIPTGRIAAEDIEDVEDYLNKVVEFENAEPAEWMKNVLHFGGGGNEFEQTLFKAYLGNYENVVEGASFGGKVFPFYKSSLDPIQINVSDSIQLLINEGTSLMTFFGHASSTGFDVNIDNPSSYNNQGKYPLLIGNSCYTGNIHLSSSLSTSENFTMAPNAGVIGFIAKGDLGLPSFLNTWSSNFYREIFQDSYGESIGQCMKKTVEAFQGNFNDLYGENTALTFSLHGDPSLVLNAWEKPELIISEESITFSPERITTDLESFQVHVEVTNIGKLLEQGYGVELIRHYPDGTDSSFVQVVDEMEYSTELVFDVPVDAVKGPGLNTFDVYVDYPAIQLDELENLSNNVLQGLSLQIVSGNLVPVYPYNFSVIPEGPDALKASTGEVLAVEQLYRFQLDTDPGFDSPDFEEIVLSGSGGVVEWMPMINWQNETVYYWRTSPDSTAEQSFDWRNSSFEVLNSKRGWGQADQGQFEQNRLTQLEYNGANELSFSPTNSDLKCTVYGNPENSYEALGTRYQINLDVMDYSGCGNPPAIHVAVIDSASFAPWETNFNGLNPQNDFGNEMACSIARERPEKYFVFRQNDPSQMQGLTDLLDGGIEDGHYLLAYTWSYADYDSWEINAPTLEGLFGEMGAAQIGLGQDSVPFIFFAKVGYPETAQELYGTSIDDELELEVVLEGVIGSGQMQSRNLGFGGTYESLEWEFEGSDTDNLNFELKGVNEAGIGTALLEFNEFSGEILDLPVQFDPDVYPSFTFAMVAQDQEEQTPLQLDYWRVLGEQLPECALNASMGFYFPKDTVAVGEEIPVAIAVSNISDYNMDSLLMSYTFSRAAEKVLQVLERGAVLNAGETIIDTVYLPTIDLQGELILSVEANAIDPQFLQYDQKEQHRFNNLWQTKVMVLEDRTNPILDVTFDGRHILNGDLVSAAPIIRASLDDENQYLLMNEPADTSSFKMFIEEPDGTQVPVYFSQDNVLWIPANQNNKSAIEYMPNLEKDGTYELLVQARDKSGNSSGDIDYRISFKVVNESSITDVLNYPNPFTTSTRFVFTVTGNEPPDEIYIQIMSISGRVVREIRTDEFGLIRVGRNISEYAWDGNDQFGDRLANGVYLYRVIAKKNGLELKTRDSGASPYFTKGIGKMYLMR